jgi:hypothetical protein
MNIGNALGRFISSPLLAAVICPVGGYALWFYSKPLAVAPPAGASTSKPVETQATENRPVPAQRFERGAARVSMPTPADEAPNSREAPARSARREPVNAKPKRTIARTAAAVEEAKPTEESLVAVVDKDEPEAIAPAASARTAADDRVQSRLAKDVKKSMSGTPESVLERRGLKKIGVYYVVDTESEFFKGFGQTRPTYNVLLATYNQLAAIWDAEWKAQYLDNERIAAQTRLRDIDIEIGGLGRMIEEQMRRNALLVEKRDVTRYLSDTVGNLAIARKQVVAPAVKQRVYDEFMKLRADFQEATNTLEPIYKQAIKEYDVLSVDPAVTDAAKTLAQRTNSPLKLGPSKNLKSAVGQLQRELRELSSNPDAYRSKSRRSSKAKKK